MGLSTDRVALISCVYVRGSCSGGGECERRRGGERERERGGREKKREREREWNNNGGKRCANLSQNLQRWNLEVNFDLLFYVKAIQSEIYLKT